tara:strand:- start:857 stop:1006 length:150 start_codon:yes stop_codon:yes gene_type:complete
LRLYSAVLATTTATVIDTGSVECPADYVISDSRKILYASASYKDDGVLL